MQIETLFEKIQELAREKEKGVASTENKHSG
jgi:hypothetical protein